MERNHESGRDTLIRIRQELMALHEEASTVVDQVPGAIETRQVLATAYVKLCNALEKKGHEGQPA